MLTVKEAAELENVTVHTIRWRINKNTLDAKCCQADGRGGKFGKQWKIDLKSLSPKAQQKWLMRTAGEFELHLDNNEEITTKKISKKQRKGALLESGGINPAAVQEICGEEIFEKDMKLAREKFNLVQEAKNIISSRLNVTKRIKDLAQKNNINVVTLYRWIKNAEAGVPGLLRRRITVVEGKRFRAINADMEVVIRSTYLKIGCPSVASVIRKVEKFCLDNNLHCPSKVTIHRFIQNLEKTDPAMCCLAREGSEAWLSKFAPHGTRAEPDRVMQIVMGDHHKFDVFVEYNKKPIRPWVTIWFDVKSRCPVGWTISNQANGNTIALALAHMMTPKKCKTINEQGEMIEETLELGGLCETLYIDNGEDYKSRLKKKEKDLSINDKTLDLCSHLGIKVVFATPYRPQAKAHIERFFGTVARIFSPEQRGWCGSKPTERPAGFDEKKLCEKGNLLSLQEFAEKFNNWVFDYYLKRVHSKLGISPIEAHFKGEKLKKGWVQPSTLDMLRCIKERAKVYKEGIRRFNRTYWHIELDKYVGQEVIIRFDPTHLGEIHVSTIKDGWICTATNAEFMKWDVCGEDIKKVAERRKKAKAALKERLADNYNAYDVFEKEAKERKKAGKNVITSDVSTTEGLLPAITSLDNTGKKIRKEREKRLKLVEDLPNNEKKDVIDEFILSKY